MNVQIKLKFLLDARAAYRGTGPDTISLSASIVRWLNHKGATVKKSATNATHTHIKRPSNQAKDTPIEYSIFNTLIPLEY